MPDFAATVDHSRGLNRDAELRSLDGHSMISLPEGDVIHELV